MSSNDRFQGKTAIVTGAGSGVGRAIALGLVSGGANVVIADLSPERAEGVVKEIKAAGGSALAISVDVADASAVRNMVAKSVEHFGKIDILISNAGWDKVMPFVETDETLWDRVIDINYRGHVACAHATIPHMIEAGYGKIVFIASDAGRVGSSGEAIYSGAKGAVIAFSKALARETARKGINVNCIAPGLTDTPMLANVSEGNEKLMGAIIRSIPLGRVGTPTEVANAALFMVSPEADYITGQTLSVNGGLSMV